VRDDIDACRRRLIEAIRRKKPHDECGCTLLICARGHSCLLIAADVGALVVSNVRDAGAARFDRIWLFQ